MVRDVREYLLEQGWTPHRRGAADGAEWWTSSATAARGFGGGGMALAAQVQLELDRAAADDTFSKRVREKLIELGWQPTGYGFLVDAIGDGRAHPLSGALDVQLRREEWHERRTGVELPTPPPVSRRPLSD